MGKEALSQQFMDLHADSKKQPAIRWPGDRHFACTHIGMGPGREGRQGNLASGWTGHQEQGWNGVLCCCLLENKNTTYFFNCCLFSLESMGIINEFLMKKNYM